MKCFRDRRGWIGRLRVRRVREMYSMTVLRTKLKMPFFQFALSSLRMYAMYLFQDSQGLRKGIQPRVMNTRMSRFVLKRRKKIRTDFSRE